MTPWAAKWAACWDEPHWRSTVVPGTVSGQPAASTALRAMLTLCSPTCMTQPMTTSSTTAGSIPVRSASALRVSAARSTGCHSLRRPLRRPRGVRIVSTMTAVGMCGSLRRDLTYGSSLARGDGARQPARPVRMAPSRASLGVRHDDDQPELGAGGGHREDRRGDDHAQGLPGRRGRAPGSRDAAVDAGRGARAVGRVDRGGVRRPDRQGRRRAAAPRARGPGSGCC